MPEAQQSPETGLGSVRTEPPARLVGSLCPVCLQRELRGRQTVCSAGCRAKRWRQAAGRAVEARRARDAETLAVVDGIARLCGLLKTRLERQR
jgi:hypothetical protein